LPNYLREVFGWHDGKLNTISQRLLRRIVYGRGGDLANKKYQSFLNSSSNGARFWGGAGMGEILGGLPNEHLI